MVGYKRISNVTNRGVAIDDSVDVDVFNERSREGQILLGAAMNARYGKGHGSMPPGSKGLIGHSDDYEKDLADLFAAAVAGDDAARAILPGWWQGDGKPLHSEVYDAFLTSDKRVPSLAAKLRLAQPNPRSDGKQPKTPAAPEAPADSLNKLVSQALESVPDAKLKLFFWVAIADDGSMYGDWAEAGANMLEAVGALERAKAELIDELLKRGAARQ